MATLQKIYRVTCEISLERVRYNQLPLDLHGVVKEVRVSDFINMFPTSEEIESCIEKYDFEVIKKYGYDFKYLNTEVVITEFLKYE